MKLAKATKLGTAVLLLVGVAFLRPAVAQETAITVTPAVTVGPWPAITKLIGFQGRLWFVNSVKGINHNSADLYSVNPEAGDLRYERHLFSQDAGDPLISNGELYWPFEDSRFSLGWGQFMATDGQDWRFGTIPSAYSFHTFAMSGGEGRLVAATSAWRAGLQLSEDAGETWQQIYDHPTAEGHVSRIVDLAALDRAVFGNLVDRSTTPVRHRLLRYADGEVSEVSGWPADQDIAALAVAGPWLYGAVWESDGTTIWRSNGVSSEVVAPLRKDWWLRDLAAGPRGFWGITRTETDGRLWFSDDGRDWREVALLKGGRPFDLALYGGRPFIGGTGSNGEGVLWAPQVPVKLVTAEKRIPEIEPATAAPSPRKVSGTTIPAPIQDWRAAGKEIDALLADPASYGGGAGRLRDRIFALARSRPPPGWFADRLATAMPDQTLEWFGGALTLPSAKIGLWSLLWGMAVAGQDGVPPEMITAPWTAKSNRAEKYFEAAPAAIWVVGLTGQDDEAALAALIGRLSAADDPDWLRGDVVGALSAITGERFAYDLDAWHSWWAARTERARNPD